MANIWIKRYVNKRGRDLPSGNRSGLIHLSTNYKYDTLNEGVVRKYLPILIDNVYWQIMYSNKNLDEYYSQHKYNLRGLLFLSNKF